MQFLGMVKNDEHILLRKFRQSLLAAMTSTSLSIGMLVAFQMFSQRVAQPLLKLSNTWKELQQIRTAVPQLGEVMRTPAERYAAAATSVGRVKGLLAAQSLGFRHAPDRPPLYFDLSFKVEPARLRC